MSRTYRLLMYRKGSPIYTKQEGQNAPYRFYRHERIEVRKWLWRSHRHRCRIAIRKGKPLPVWKNTCGWESW